MKESLLFDQFTWLVFVAPFLGLLVAGLSKRQDPIIKGTRVLRHDGPARVSHWTHAIGTAFLLLSGIILGTRFTPSFVTDDSSTALWFNIHFIFVLLFLFGTFYWLGNTLISRWRFREHLPTSNAIPYTLNHYGSLLGVKKCTYPKEAKYFQSERLAFILAILATVIVLLSGLLKVLAHVVALPEGLMNVTTWVHDLSAALMLLFFVAHIFFGLFLPVSWKTLRSMFTGYVPLDQVKHEHAAWFEERSEKGAIEDPDAIKHEIEDAESLLPALEYKEGVEHV